MVQMSAREYPPEHGLDVRSWPAMNVLRCHAGSTRIFFISGTNYSGGCRENQVLAAVSSAAARHSIAPVGAPH